MENTYQSEIVSLLWPKGLSGALPKNIIAENEGAVKDFEIEDILIAMNAGGGYAFNIDTVLPYMTDDTDTLKYRLDIIDDLLQNPQICACLKELLPKISDLESLKKGPGVIDQDIMKVVNRLGELEIYAECMQKLFAAFRAALGSLKSEGLNRLNKCIKQTADSEQFKNLVNELPAMREGFSKLASITIGVNLDEQLRPVEAILMSINEQKFKSGSIMDRLMNLEVKKDEYTGISPLQVIDEGRDAEAVKRNWVFKQAILSSVNKLLTSIVKPVAPVIAKYTAVNGELLIALIPDIIFYLSAVKIVNKMQGCGMPMCKPEVRPKEDRICIVEGLYNLNLALHTYSKDSSGNISGRVIASDVDFSESGRIFILTGPNRGGKTTFTQAVGLSQVLLQLGLYIPGKKAAMSPVDRIFSHFPVEEKSSTNMGRMGEECSRLSEIFNDVTRYSLILLNESLSSTSPGEGLYIAREIVMGLKMACARAIYVTHFHELAENLDKINSAVPGESRIESLVAGTKEAMENSNEGISAERTYKVVKAPPQGLSYAREIAAKYGVSIEKIYDSLKKRNIVDENLNITRQ